jgi:hypothetical protein
MQDLIELLKAATPIIAALPAILAAVAQLIRCLRQK